MITEIDHKVNQNSADTGATFRIAINPYYVGKLPKDAPNQVWDAFNNSFKTLNLTPSELAAHIQQGRAITADCGGKKRKVENFVQRQDLGLDFDTEDQRSALDTLEAHPFIAQYANRIHTTASHTEEAPRSRVIFILDRPVTDPNQYREYGQAINWLFQTSDAQCFDPVRVWFGALGCELRVLGNILPCSVMDELVKAWKAAQPAPAPSAPAPTAPSADAHELLDQALKEGRAGNRNNTGFNLARWLRDAGYTIDQAREIVLIYQQTVERLASPYYTAREATDSLASAYSQRPRVDASIDALEVDAIIDSLENAVIAGEIEISANVQKTYFGLTSKARKLGKLEFGASVRELERESGVSISSIVRHVPDLVEDGLLQVTQKSNHRKATVFKLLIPAKVKHSQQGTLPTALSVSLLPVCAQHYQGLQNEPICAISAQVHPLMARTDDELIQSFGASAQRILACLLTLPDGVDSLETLQETAHLSERTVRNKVRTLEQQVIVEVIQEGTRRRVKLAKYWREAIDAITPALTSFGQDILRSERAAKQRIAHHEHMAKLTGNPDKKAFSNAVIVRSEDTLKLLQEHKAEAYRERQQWMQDNGMDPTQAPPLSLHPRARNKASRKVNRVNGRDLTPSDKAVTKPNGLLLAEMPELEAQRKTLQDNVAKLRNDGTGPREIYRILKLAGYEIYEVKRALQGKDKQHVID